MPDLFLQLLDPDPRKAEQASERLRRRLIFYFQHNLSPEAEDLAQDTLLRVLEKLPQMQRDAVNVLTDNDLIQFAFGVARNVAMEGHRRPKWGARAEGFPEGVESDERFSSREPNPETSVLAKEKWDLVQECLRTLEVPRRKLLSSWFLDEKAMHADIAQSLGLSPNALRIRIHHSLAKVRDCVRTRVAKQRS